MPDVELVNLTTFPPQRTTRLSAWCPAGFDNIRRKASAILHNRVGYRNPVNAPIGVNRIPWRESAHG